MNSRCARLNFSRPVALRKIDISAAPIDFINDPPWSEMVVALPSPDEIIHKAREVP